MKKNFLVETEYRNLEFGSQPLDDLLHEFADKLRTIYWAEIVDHGDIRIKGLEVYEELEGVTSLVELFNKALERSDWLRDDRTADQFPARTEA